MPDVAIAILVFGPVAITYLLKSNAALGFLALCVGFVLNTSVIGNLEQLLSQMNLSVANDTVGALLLLVPFSLTLLFTRHTKRKGPIFIAQLLAALAGGGLLALSIGPLLSSSSQLNITNSGAWTTLTNAQASIIGIGGILSLGLVWLSNFRSRSKH